jgi:transcriptional regulator with XRE-family HTH domain
VSHTLQGEDLRRWRESQDLTQEEAARALGVAREWLNKIENGKAPVSAELYLRFEAIKRDPAFTREKPGAPLLIQEDAAPFGPAESARLVTEIREKLQQLLNATGGDPRRLGWLHEELERMQRKTKDWDLHLQGALQAIVGAEAKEQERLRKAGINPDAKEKTGHDVA